MFYMLNNQKQLIIISFFFRPNQALKGAGLTLELTLAEPANVFTCCLATDGKHWAGGGGAGFTSGGGVDGLGSTATNGMAAGANYVTPGVDAASFSYAIQNVEYIASTIEFDGTLYKNYGVDVLLRPTRIFLPLQRPSLRPS